MLASLSEGTSVESIWGQKERWGNGRLLKMKDCSQLLNLHPNSIRRLCEGENPKLVCLRLPSGARRFTLESVQKFLGINTDTVIDDGQLKQEKSFRVPIAAVIRVSSAKQNAPQGESAKSSLQNQEERVAAFIKQRWGSRADITWHKSVGSGLDFSRPSFLKLVENILDGKYASGYVVATDFTRICRFGISMVEYLCKLGKCELIYSMDEKEVEKSENEALADEIISLLTVFTAKASARKAKKILTVRVQPETVEEICRMGRQGYSYRYIAQELARQGKGRGECGREITKRICERVIKEHGEGLKLVEANTSANSSASVTQNSFVEYFTTNVKQTGEDRCRVRQSVLIEKYRQWCKASGRTPMTATSVRKTLKSHFPGVERKWTDDACVSYSGLTFISP